MRRRLPPSRYSTAGARFWRDRLGARHERLAAEPGAPALLRRDDAAGVATLTLQSPASRNALSLAMIEALIDAFAAIATDPATRVVVLAGDGPALSAGHDLKELQAHRNDADRGAAFFDHGDDALRRADAAASSRCPSR